MSDPETHHARTHNTQFVCTGGGRAKSPSPPPDYCLENVKIQEKPRKNQEKPSKSQEKPRKDLEKHRKNFIFYYVSNIFLLLLPYIAQ